MDRAVQALGLVAQTSTTAAPGNYGHNYGWEWLIFGLFVIIIAGILLAVRGLHPGRANRQAQEKQGQEEQAQEKQAQGGRSEAKEAGAQ